MLMVGVTLALGSVVVAAAMGQFSRTADSASVGASLVESSQGVGLGLIYATTAPSGSCPTYGGAQEGEVLALSLYNYGAMPFTPAEILVNSTVYRSSLGTLDPGVLGTYTLPIDTCAHSAGQTILVVDSSGVGVQFES